MKKAIRILTIALCVIAFCGIFTACDGGTLVGTYKFASMYYTNGTVTINYKVGQEIEGVDITFTEDYCTLVVNEDGTFTMTTEAVEGLSEETTLSGTWEKRDGKYILTVDGEEQVVSLSGRTLVMESSGVKITMKKQ